VIDARILSWPAAGDLLFVFFLKNKKNNDKQYVIHPL
jgi:hypothetical protein